MRRTLGRTLVFASVLVALVAFGCDGGGGDGGGDGNGNGQVGNSERTVVRGVVRTVDGFPIGSVHVAAGMATATTSEFGEFELDAAVGTDVTVTFERDGFLPQIQRVTVLDKKATALDVKMARLAQPLVLDSSVGGTVAALDSAAAVIAGPGAFVGPGGVAINGDVDVHLTPLDPSVPEQLAAFPGDLRASRTDGSPVRLESFGVLDVTVMQGGEELQIAAGETVTIHIPAPAGATDIPDTIPIWSFDESAGVWVEEGVGSYDADAGAFVAEIGHLSYWNADKVEETTCLSGRVVYADGTPAPGAFVVASGTDYSGSATATADENGAYCINVKKNSSVLLTASDGAGAAGNVTATSGAEDAAVPPVCSACPAAPDVVLQRAACNGMQQPFAGTCAEGMWDIMSCFDADGACTMESSDGGMTISYESGARYEVVFTGAMENMQGAMTLYNSNGQKCGELDMGDVATAEEGDPITQTATAPNGETWTLTMPDDGTAMTVQCENGEIHTMTAEEIDLLRVCYGGGDEEECTSSTGDIGGIDTCSSNADCPAEASECCDVMGSRYCMPPETCQMMAGFGCERDSDCESGQSCCISDEGNMGMCMPEGFTCE